MNQVIEVPVAMDSTVRQSLATVHFADAYQVTLSSPHLSAEDAYQAIFGYSPSWVKLLMRLRGLIVGMVGLQHKRFEPIQANGQPGQRPGKFQVGQQVGLFTVRATGPSECIVGDDDKHLNFRISVRTSPGATPATVTVSTVVEMHNAFGRFYMAVIKPFHRMISRTMLQRAVDAGRL